MSKAAPAPLGKDSYNRDQVVGIVNSVLSKVSGTQEIQREAVYNELMNLKTSIEDLRHQLTAAQADNINQVDIPNVRDELDLIIGATEKATNTIMEASETILSQMNGAAPELQQKTEAQVVRIYEACTFQDITGQRITKVISTLKKIDESVSSLLTVLNSQLVQLGKSEPRAADPAKDPLLNGPAMPQEGISQEEIDKLLESF
jgi:chemotaxis protein CheZ